MKRVELSGILLDVLKKRIEEYRNRQDDVIYAHMLDDTVWRALKPEDLKKIISGYTLIGELAHAGLTKVLEPAGQRCRTVYLSRRLVRRLHRRISERFLHYDNGNPFVVVCGSADAIYNNMPVELKTTRRPLNGRLPERWVRRARVYGWLYQTAQSYLIVINLVDGTERDEVLKSYSDEEMEWIIKKWLLGEWPSRTLPSFHR